MHFPFAVTSTHQIWRKYHFHNITPKKLKLAMKNLLTIDSVSKKFGSFTALNNVSIDIPEGCIYGLLGPNGAGKTTLIRIINQISLPDTGKVFLNDQELNASHIRQIGYLPEERGLYPKMKIGEQAIYLAQLKGMDRKKARLELKKWFEKMTRSATLTTCPLAISIADRHVLELKSKKI